MNKPKLCRANESMDLNESSQEVDIEKVADDIINELDSLTTEKVLSILNTSTRHDIDTSSSMFILPNGDILSVADALTTNSIDDMFDDIHDSIGYVLVYNLAKQMNVEESFMDILDDTYIDRKLDSIMSILTYDLGWARINCGTTLKEDRFYCVLPNHMKSTQYHTLQNWLEWGYDTGKQKVLVFASSYEDGNWYSFSDNFPEDIIKKIKRYYSSGRLYENVNNKDLLSFIYENAPLQKEPYWWSTFILPDGRFVDILSLGGEDYGEHEDFYGWLYDNGYKSYEQDIVDGIGCIKLNVTYPYATCPSSIRPTPQQLRALEKWLDGISDTSDFQIQGCEDNTRKMLHPVAIVTNDYKIYDLDVTSPRDIIKAIQKSYSSGILENRNELKENMDDFSINELSKMTNPNKGDRATIVDNEDREWNFVANYWSKQGYYPGMVWEGQNGNPWMSSFGTSLGAIKSEFPRGVKKVTINNLNEEFVYELVPGELYHFIHNNKILYGTFKRKTPAWLFFDVEGEEVLVKPWTSVATTTEELEELIGLVNKMERDTKIPSQVPNRFTRVPNQHNKPMGESNELADRAKKHKKKSKGMGWHMAVNAGDVEKGIEVFNNSTSLGSGTSGGECTAMGEALDQTTYYYDGPVYYDGRKILEKSDIYTTAKSLNIAIRNTLFKAAKGDRENLYHYDIVDHLVREVPKNETPKVRPKCQTCGYELNDIGDCPVCDYGEDDLLESLSSLEALWELSNLD